MSRVRMKMVEYFSKRLRQFQPFVDIGQDSAIRYK